MSNPEDEMGLLDDDFRKEIAERIVGGVEEWLEGCEDSLRMGKGKPSFSMRRSGQSMIIREWTREDLPAVRHITWETWVATYSSFIPMEDLRGYCDEHYSIDALAELMESPSFRGLLAIEDGVPVGYAKVKYNSEEKRCYLSSLYILPAFQGGGIGSRLLAAGEKFAGTYGVGEVWLGVMVQNSSALAWYRKIGFEFVEEAPFTMGKTTVTHLIGYRAIPQQGGA